MSVRTFEAGCAGPSSQSFDDFDQQSKNGPASVACSNGRAYVGTHSLRCSMGPSSGANYARGIMNHDSAYRQGDEYWWGGAFYLEPGFYSRGGYTDIMRMDNYVIPNSGGATRPLNDQMDFSVECSSGNQWRVVYRERGSFEDYLIVFGNGAAGLSSGEWHWIELHVKLHGTSGLALTELYIDGVLRGSSTRPNINPNQTGGFSAQGYNRARCGIVSIGTLSATAVVWVDRYRVGLSAAGPIGGSPPPPEEPPPSDDPAGTPTFADYQEGGSTGTSVTSGTLTTGTDRAWIAFIDSRGGTGIGTVTGGGLTWTKRKELAGGRGQHILSAWTAFGSPASNFGVTATQADGLAHNAAIAVVAYDGADPAAPFGASAAYNTNGADGATTGGTDNTQATFTVTPTVDPSRVVACTAARMNDVMHESEYANWRGQIEFPTDESGDVVSAWVADRGVSPAASETYTATLAAATDWVSIGVVIQPPAPDEPVFGEYAEAGSAGPSVTSSGLAAATGRAFVAFVASRGGTGIGTVSGGGLTWTKQKEQPAGQGNQILSVWTAYGSPASSFQVTATQTDGSAHNMTIAVIGYDDADPSEPFGEAVTFNTNGEDGAGTGGTANTAPTFTVTTTRPESTIIACVAPRMVDVAHDADYTAKDSIEYPQPDSSETVGLWTASRLLTAAGDDTYVGSVSSVDWITAAVVVQPAEVANPPEDPPDDPPAPPAEDPPSPPGRIVIREKPPLRHTVEVEAVSGRRYRWAFDALRPEDVVSDLRHSSTMPGGYEQMDCTLARDPRRDYSDLERFSTLRVRSATHRVVGEYRLERAPLVSGDQLAISPSAVGWQAHLEDDQSASEVFIDQDLTAWGSMASERRLDLITASNAVFDPEVKNDTSVPRIYTTLRGPWSVGAIAEAMYDAGASNHIGEIFWAYAQGQNVDWTNPNWNWSLHLGDNYRFLNGTYDSPGDLSLAATNWGYFQATTKTRRYANLQSNFAVAGGGSGLSYDVYWNVGVYGAHGLQRRVDPNAEGNLPDGFHASDIVAYVVGRWAPMLRFSTGPDGTITPSTFVITQLAFKEPTTAGEMVRQSTRFGLQDWAVWDDRVFHWHERGDGARRWRARVGTTKLEETGSQADRVWNSIIVSYRDVSGQTKTVGPPGSGADTESADLVDTDPENPANKLGIIRRDLLQMGVGTPASATEVGKRFLEEAKRLDSSGRASIVGWVESDRGVLHPFSHIRAGDELSFIDSSDASYRRVVKADHSHTERACAVDIDAPPEGLQALLERLNVQLVPLGL